MAVRKINFLWNVNLVVESYSHLLLLYKYRKLGNQSQYKQNIQENKYDKSYSSYKNVQLLLIKIYQINKKYRVRYKNIVSYM